MRKLALLGLITVVAAILFTGVAHADDYAGGTPPKNGSVAPTNVHFVPASNSDTQVLGIQFTRTQNGLATTGADIAEMVGIALVAIAIGVVMVRRGRPRSAPPAAA